jgi:acetyltransferase-like isoleucine patch superfamily enzyme
MRAVFQTGVRADWEHALGDRPWCLAPAGGKPLVEYWLEWAAELGADDVRLVLGDGADEVEAFCGDGSRWGLRITYGFLKDMSDPEAYLRRSPGQWEDGLLYIAAPVFPRRRKDPAAENTPRVHAPLPGHAWLLHQQTGRPACFLSRDAAAIRAFIGGPSPVSQGDWAELGIEPLALVDLNAYYELNMRLVQGEISRYVPPGFGGGDNAFIGSNVVLPPSVELRPPLIIGNDCRINPMAVIGPNAVIGNRVIVDRQTVLSDSVILDDTYLGRNLEIAGRVVSGTRLIAPTDGTAVDIADPWLLAQLEAPIRVGDLCRAAGGWLGAVALTLLQAVPFALFYLLIRVRGTGGFRFSQRLATRARVQRLPLWVATDEDSRLNRVFTGLSLDLFPLIALAALGRLWLCGHAPLHPERDAELRRRLRRYYPAAIGYHSLRLTSGDRPTAVAEALYYERHRTPFEDLRILVRVLAGRLLTRLSGSSQDSQ